MHGRTLLVLGLVLFTAKAAAAETYPVQLARPSKVGEAVDLDETWEMQVHEVRTVQGKSPTTRDSSQRFHLVGRCTALAVDGRGVATRVRCEVAKSVQTIDGRTSQVFPAWTVLEATNTSGRTDYTRADGVPVTGSALIVRQLFDVRPPGAPAPHEVFPPGGPRSVGDSWPMDVGKYADGYRLAGKPLPKHTSGRATLIRVTKGANGLTYAVIQYTTESSGTEFPTTRPGATRTLGNSMTVGTVTFPLDPNTPGSAVESRTSSDIVVHDTTSDGTPFDLVTHYVSEQRGATTPVQP